MKIESIESLTDSPDLKTIILRFVYCAINIDVVVVTDMSVDYFLVAEMIEYNFVVDYSFDIAADFVVLTYHGEFSLNRVKKQFFSRF